MPSVKPAALTLRRSRLLLLLLGLLLVLMASARLDNWIYKNETFNGLAFGLRLDAAQESLDLLRQDAERLCRQRQDESLGRCLGYQGILAQNFYFSHPLTAAFGRSLLLSQGEDDWLGRLQLTAAAGQMAGAGLAILLCLLFLSALPQSFRPVAAASLIALVLLGFFRDDGSSLFPDPMDLGPQWWEAIVIACAAGLLFLPLRQPTEWRLGATLGGLGSGDRVMKALPAMALTLAVLHAVLPEAASWVIQIAGLLLFGFCALTVLEGRERTSLVGVLIALLFFFVVLGSSEANLVRKMEVSKHQLFLAFSAYCAYAAAVPRGRLIWSLPILAVFHVPVLGVLSLALFLAELPICLRRLRVSPLALVSALTALGCILYTNSLGSDLVGTGTADFGSLVTTVVSSGLFLPALLTVVTILALSLWALFLPKEPMDLIARSGFLLAQGLAILAISQAILQTDPALRLDPSYFVFAELPWKTLPGITLAVVVMLAMALTAPTAPTAMTAETGEPESPKRPQVRQPYLTGLLFALILAVGCAKLELKPRDIFWEPGRNAYAYFWARDLDDRWQCNFGAVAGADDRYALSRNNPTNDPINFLSKLKLMLRASLGLHDPEQMSIALVTTDEKGCAP